MAKTNDLINVIASKHQITQSDSKEIIEIMFEYLKEKISEKQRVEIRNFGVFSMKDKKNNLNWINKHSLCNKDCYNVINYKMSHNLHLKLNKIEKS